jgi:transposase
MKRIDCRHLSPSAQEAVRKRAVAAVLEGATRTEVGRMYGVSRQTVGGWVRVYFAEGEEGLSSRRRGPEPGSANLLTPEQEAQVMEALQDRRPEQLALPFYLWTREAVALLIRQKFHVEMSRSTVGRYLKRWGFTPQKPMRRAKEQNRAAVDRWLKEEYPQIRKEAKKEKAAIYWGDEMGLRSDHAVGRSYSPRGKTPVIQGTGQRFQCNMISAITNQGALSFMVFRENFTVSVFLRFLRRLVRQNQHRVYLIVDGHPVHRAKLVSAWLEKHSHQIRLIRLPPYSPEINPDEMLNQDVKSNALGRKRPETLEQLIADVKSYLRRRQRQPEVISRFFRESHVLYAAA